VASEVRNLAQRASEAAKEVNTVLSRSDKAVADGVDKVGAAHASLSKIADSVFSISTAVEDISTAIEEQVLGIGEINSAITHIDQNTQRQAASLEEITAASALLATEADRLDTSTARFNIKPGGETQYEHPAEHRQVG